MLDTILLPKSIFDFIDYQNIIQIYILRHIAQNTNYERVYDLKYDIHHSGVTNSCNFEFSLSGEFLIILI